MWFIVACTLIDNEYASLLFCQTLFPYCFCALSDFAKVFDRKVWRVQVAYLHNAARALGVFNCQQILAKISFAIFDIVIKKQIECGLAWCWWSFTDLGLIDKF